MSSEIVIKRDFSKFKVQVQPHNQKIPQKKPNQDRQNLYITEYSKILGISDPVRAKAEDLYKTLLTKNIEGRNEHCLTLVCIYISGKLMNERIGLFDLESHDETRIILMDFFQIYNQAIALIDRSSKLDKLLSYELVKWTAIFEKFEKEGFSAHSNTTLGESFFWYLFVYLYHHLENITVTNCVSLNKVYMNYLLFVKKELIDLPIALKKMDFYDVGIYANLRRAYVKLQFYQPCSKRMKDNIKLLDKHLDNENDVIYFKKLFVSNKKLVGNYFMLTTVKIVNIFNRVNKLENMLDLILDNYRNMQTNIPSVSRKFDDKIHVVPKYLCDREKREVENLYNFVLDRILVSESDRLKEKYNEQLLLGNVMFRRSLLFCCVSCVLFCNGNFHELKTKKILHACGVPFFEGGKMIEIFLKELSFLNSSVKKYFKYVEERFYLFFIWKGEQVKNKIMRRKIYQLIYQRINDLCSLFNQVILKEDIVNMFKIVYFFLTDKVEVVRERHLDQIIMCGIYVYLNKVMKMKIQFRDIMLNYKYLCENILFVSPIEITKILFAIRITETKRGDVVYFYNKVFITNVKDVIFNLSKVKLPKALNLDEGEDDASIHLTPRRRKRLYNTNLFISPRVMSPNKLTPRTKKLYSFGEYSINKEKDVSGPFENPAKKRKFNIGGLKRKLF